MKKLSLVPIAILALTVAHTRTYAQWTYSVTFESNSQLVSIDTSQVNNIWQIGKPQKYFFDSAYSKPKVIVTDTINKYPINNISSFQIVIKSGVSFWGSGAFPYLKFYHKFDTDSLKDGGYIESSIDGGTTWINIANNALAFSCYVPYGLNDTISGGIHAFTGKSGIGWSCFNIWWAWCYPNSIPNPIPDSIMVRFTFKSDNTQTNKDGWMIDNIEFGTQGCPIGVNEIIYNLGLTISPNPFSLRTTLRTADLLKNATLALYNSFGQIVKQIENLSGQTITLQRDDLPSGLYFLRLTQDNKVITTEKLVISDR